MQGGKTPISASTADAILMAARTLFSDHGYDGTGLRAIADLAGVNVALIGRYFGSKEGLFLAAVPPMLDIGGLVNGPMSEFGIRAANLMDMRANRGFDPMLALIRTAASPSCAPALQAALDTQVIAPLASRLEGGDRHARAGLILATMAGYDLMKRIIAVDALQGGAGIHRRDHLAAALQQIVDRDTVME
ncbi:TetR family transcriptional regulator [Alphaproteobacteria bacterium LSUCC0719]